MQSLNGITLPLAVPNLSSVLSLFVIQAGNVIPLPLPIGIIGFALNDDDENDGSSLTPTVVVVVVGGGGNGSPSSSPTKA